VVRSFRAIRRSRSSGDRDSCSLRGEFSRTICRGPGEIGGRFLRAKKRLEPRVIPGLARRSRCCRQLRRSRARRGTASWVANTSALVYARRGWLAAFLRLNYHLQIVLGGYYSRVDSRRSPPACGQECFTRELKPTQSHPLPRHERDARIKEVIGAYSSARARARVYACGVRLGVSDALPHAEIHANSGEYSSLAITKSYELIQLIRDSPP